MKINQSVTSQLDDQSAATAADDERISQLTADLKGIVEMTAKKAGRRNKIKAAAVGVALIAFMFFICFTAGSTTLWIVAFSTVSTVTAGVLWVWALATAAARSEESFYLEIGAITLEHSRKLLKQTEDQRDHALELAHE